MTKSELLRALELVGDNDEVVLTNGQRNYEIDHVAYGARDYGRQRVIILQIGAQLLFPKFTPDQEDVPQ